MRRIYIYAILLLVCLLSAQENYRSVEQIETEWGNHTNYQRDEMLSFCDFLFNEGYYERCLVSSFQFLYRLPDDPLKPAILYLIAKSYENMGNYSLARRYYNRVMQIEPETSIAYKASKYREVFSFLMEGDSKSVLRDTEASKDPYFLTLRGYSYLQDLKWEEARASFVSAEERFNSRYYSKLMTPLFQVIENVSNVKQHSHMKIAMSGMLLPGGGQLALKDKQNGQGILFTSLLLFGMFSLGDSNDMSGTVIFDNSPGAVLPIYKGVSPGFQLSDGSLSRPVLSKSSFLKYTVPPLVIAATLHIASVIKSFKDTNEKNKGLIRYYALNSIESIPPKKFLDFEEPSIINNKNY